jgi:hypothetical protein
MACICRSASGELGTHASAKSRGGRTLAIQNQIHAALQILRGHVEVTQMQIVPGWETAINHPARCHGSPNFSANANSSA